jgi:coenzyme F420-reducing hydrogenase gamma subunit
MSVRDDNYQIAFVEGSYTRSVDKNRLKAIREQAKLVVALGSCAYIGGVNSLRNLQSLENARRYVYGSMWKVFEADPAHPVSAVIQIDAYIPGCPIDRDEFIRAVKALLQGRLPAIPDYPVCVECKLNEIGCVVLQGKSCLGAVTRAGCGAICPAFRVGCEGCRGLISNPNLTWLESAHVERGLDKDELRAKLKLFTSYQMMESG